MPFQPVWLTTRPANSPLGGIFDYEVKAARLEVVNAELEDPKI